MTAGRPTLERRRTRDPHDTGDTVDSVDTVVEPPFDIRPYLSPFAGALAGGANVIMQLSWPAVGYGVKESRVESGSAMKHPFKRTRTTFTYLAVALLGGEDDRDHFRRAVNRQHAQVRSDPASPVAYNALDPRLQLWVAACLYHGLTDVISQTRRPLDEATAERLYAYAARLGTSLQVRPEMWPADRAAFTAYWEESLREVSIDDPIREYLMRLVRLENLPRFFQVLSARSNQFWTTGFLPPLFRRQMRLPWSEADEARFVRSLRRLGRIEDLIPPWGKALPFNLLLWDMRRRVRAGRPLV